jgi:acetyl-CoA carboxylase biotin carboxylase subunit
MTFIGPSPASIRAMGDKAQAKATMKAAGVPCIPGSDCLVHNLK